MGKMRATVFYGVNDIRVEEVPRPHAGVGEAVIRVTLTTICGTDLHILRGEYPVNPGLIIGHEPVGIIDELGPGVTGYEIGERVLVGAITPCGQASRSSRWNSLRVRRSPILRRKQAYRWMTNFGFSLKSVLPSHMPIAIWSFITI